MKQILSILLIIQLLVHSFSIILSAHWCKGELVKAGLSMIDLDISCTDLSDPSTCDKEQQQGIRATASCCLTQHFKVETDNDFVFKSQLVSAIDVPFIPLFRIHGIFPAIESSANILPGNHDPPGCKETLILYQVFRC